MLIILKEIGAALPQIYNLRHLKARQLYFPLYLLIALIDVNIPRNELTPHLIGHRLDILVLLVLRGLWIDSRDIAILHLRIERFVFVEFILVGFE